jgi:hypothetical protein
MTSFSREKRRRVEVRKRKSLLHIPLLQSQQSREKV